MFCEFSLEWGAVARARMCTCPIDLVVLLEGHFLGPASRLVYDEAVVNVAVHQRARRRVADNLKKIIKESGTEKKALAKAAKMSRNTLDRILDGKAGATIDSLGRLADALGVELVDLVR